MRGNFGAFALIFLGAFFLLSNLHVIDISLVEVFRTWWPAILIAVGISMVFTNRNDRGGKS